MSIKNVDFIFLQGAISFIEGCSSKKRNVPTAEEVLEKMKIERDEDYKKKRAFPAVERGDLNVYPNSLQSESVQQQSPYGNYKKAKLILQDVFLVLIEVGLERLKTSKDPKDLEIKKQLMEDKRNFLEHPEVFGKTTSKYLKELHKLVGLYKIDYVSYTLDGREDNKVKRAIETIGGPAIFNYLSVAILKKALEAVKDEKNWEKAVKDMFDSVEKIDAFHKENNINGALMIKLKRQPHTDYLYPQILDGEYNGDTLFPQQNK